MYYNVILHHILIVNLCVSYVYIHVLDVIHRLYVCYVIYLMYCIIRLVLVKGNVGIIVICMLVIIIMQVIIILIQVTQLPIYLPIISSHNNVNHVSIHANHVTYQV